MKSSTRKSERVPSSEVNPVPRRKSSPRTVNKQRRKEGRTPRETTQGTGNPHTRLEERTVDELYNLAKEHHIQGRSKLNKAELIEAIRDKR